MSLAELHAKLMEERATIEKKFFEDMAALDKKEEEARALAKIAGAQAATRARSPEQIQENLNRQYAQRLIQNAIREARNADNWARDPVMKTRKRPVAELAALGIEQPHLQPGAALIRAERASVEKNALAKKVNRKSRRLHRRVNRSKASRRN